MISLKARSGLSLAQIADKAGYQGASSIQKLFRGSYAPDRLQRSVADRLAKAFVGLGEPAIEEHEILALADVGTVLDKMLADLSHHNYEASKYVILHKTRRIDSTVRSETGLEVPLFVMYDQPLETAYWDSNQRIQAKRVSAFYVTVGNMWPRYEEGEVLFFDRSTPAKPGDDVLVSVINEGYLDGGMILGRLYLLHDEEIQIDQFSPKARIVIPRGEVISVNPILSHADLMPSIKYARTLD
ncbi:LexA family transcriptional regulator [Sphingomonas sp. PB2P19]